MGGSTTGQLIERFDISRQQVFAITEYSNKLSDEVITHKLKKLKPDMNPHEIRSIMTAEGFLSRGIGTEFGMRCFVCGAKPSAEWDGVSNIAAFVIDRAAGERVVAMFAEQGSVVSLDYRPHEPTYVQVKIRACAYAFA